MGPRFQNDTFLQRKQSNGPSHSNVQKYRPRVFFYNAKSTNKQEHWCETCDRGYRSVQQLDSHIAEHQKCGIDGCKFIGHPKIVTKHIQMQHSTGLYSKIRNLETPEDIANWIKERKKNYPTKENVKKKQLQRLECDDRGEKIGTKKSKFNRQQKRGHHFERKPQRGGKRKFSRYDKMNTRSNETNTECDKNINKILEINDTSDSEVYCNIQAFKGISELIRRDMINEDIKSDLNVDIEIEEDEWESIEIEESENVTVCKALANLIDAYKSDDDESDIENSVIDTSNPSKPQTKETVLNHCIVTINDNDDSGPEEIPVSKCESRLNIINEMSSNIHEDGINKDFINYSNCMNKEDNGTTKKENEKSINTLDKTCNVKCNKRSRKRKNPSQEQTEESINSNNPSNCNKKFITGNHMNTFERQLEYYKKRPSTLLEKLLEKEIKHERNVILQCINYIVKNNFFESDL